MWKNTGPSATADGGFSDGDPTTGAGRSIMVSAWPNMIQDELQALVQQAPFMTLNPDDNQQLPKALTVLSGRQGNIPLDEGMIFPNSGNIWDVQVPGTGGATSLAYIYLASPSPLYLRASAAMTLIHDWSGGAVSSDYGTLQLPGGSNIAAAAGDTWILVRHDYVWRIWSYVRAATPI